MIFMAMSILLLLLAVKQAGAGEQKSRVTLPLRLCAPALRPSASPLTAFFQSAGFVSNSIYHTLCLRGIHCHENMSLHASPP
jgi:hypothetical protein